MVITDLDVVKDSGARCGQNCEESKIDQFVFEAAPEGLGKDVIVAVTRATQAIASVVIAGQLPSRSGGFELPIALA